MGRRRPEVTSRTWQQLPLHTGPARKTPLVTHQPQGPHTHNPLQSKNRNSGITPLALPGKKGRAGVWVRRVPNFQQPAYSRHIEKLTRSFKSRKVRACGSLCVARLGCCCMAGLGPPPLLPSTMATFRGAAATEGRSLGVAGLVREPCSPGGGMGRIPRHISLDVMTTPKLQAPNEPSPAVPHNLQATAQSMRPGA